ncbi:hypothetical protein ZIOFF_045816 [Zingiber officinale]|uniref:PHD-type zinc finger plants domain-containing protein n=1 Tax=Zingiber officinale TaxID=94328 RepID=A0A8J5FZW0_ZINOF|nr:hypothetical protein ZIOFF_045816 [Zingiber officinale]
MCGDVGFADKLFLCIRCNYRFQHSYCTNYYEEAALASPAVCDWCICESRSASEAKRVSSLLYSKKPTAAGRDHSTGSSGSGAGDSKLKQSSEQEQIRGRSKSGATAASSKPTARRTLYVAVLVGYVAQKGGQMEPQNTAPSASESAS